MSMLTLSGWGQPPDALAPVCPAGTQFFNYAAYPSVDACMAELGKHQCDTVIGWSLGGQIAVRAVAAGILRPKRLVLIAAPFQCCADAFFENATPAAMLAASRAALVANADAMMQQFIAFLAMGDSNPQNIIHHLMRHRATIKKQNWLFWFDELVRFSCRSLDFHHFPPTDIIHGDHDAVIRFPQALAFENAIPNATLHKFSGCGHVPHWHDPERVRQIIAGAG